MWPCKDHSSGNNTLKVSQLKFYEPMIAVLALIEFLKRATKIITQMVTAKPSCQCHHSLYTRLDALMLF
jgi:hypothetical protein